MLYIVNEIDITKDEQNKTASHFAWCSILCVSNTIVVYLPEEFHSWNKWHFNY